METWSPLKKFYYIPLLKQIEVLQTLDEFNDSLPKMKDQITTVGVTELEGFWGGQLVKKYLEDPNFMVLSIFFFFFLIDIHSINQTKLCFIIQI